MFQVLASRKAAYHRGIPHTLLSSAVASYVMNALKFMRGSFRLAVQPPRLSEKGLEVKKPRRAFGDITNSTPPAQRDAQVHITNIFLAFHLCSTLLLGH